MTVSPALLRTRRYTAAAASTVVPAGWPVSSPLRRTAVPQWFSDGFDSRRGRGTRLCTVWTLADDVLWPLAEKMQALGETQD